MSCPDCNRVDRRSFLKFAIGGTALSAFTPVGSLFGQDGTTVTAGARGKACILLWMRGGQSQLDTWDPKPGRKTGGPIKAIPTSVRGMQLSHNLPLMARQAKHFSIIRSLTTREAAHERGTFLMHTGYSPIAGQPFAPVGTVASYELSRKGFPLPTYVAIRPPEIPQCEIFGERHLPFSVEDVNNPVPNIRALVGSDREELRREMLERQEEEFGADRPGREMERRRESSKRAQDLMTTPLMKAFDIKREKEKVRNAYGGGFGKNCLLARRLVEVGVPFVEISLPGWDTHDNNFDRVKGLSGQLDRGFSALLGDLADRNLLENTLVICAGEFGRTPVINSRKGRDHWTRCWSAVLAGGGIQGGRVIGETDRDGMEIRRRPVNVQSLFATIYSSLGIDPEKRYVVNGRKVRYSYNGKPVKELF